jgi:hypothetical protein
MVARVNANPKQSHAIATTLVTILGTRHIGTVIKRLTRRSISTMTPSSLVKS